MTVFSIILALIVGCIIGYFICFAEEHAARLDRDERDGWLS